MVELKNKSVLVLGLGRFGGGIGVTRYLINQGAKVRVSDSQSQENLQDSISQLKDLDIDYRLGSHEINHLEGIDLVIVNPAIPPNHPFIKEIETLNIPQTTEVNLFFERCPAAIIGIVGTNGKESVVRMIELMEKDFPYKLFIGGNVGRSLLNDVDSMTYRDRVIFELSSFQLHRLRWIKQRPSTAILLNIQPDHLDWHGTFENYLADKLVVLEGQGEHGDAIINMDDPYFSKSIDKVEGTLIKTSLHQLDEGVYVDNGYIVAKDKHGLQQLSTTKLKVPGKHNLSNALQAAAYGYAEAKGPKKIEEALTNFTGVPHALEFVGEFNGVLYYNDSAATNPDATQKALESFDQPIWLIAGGYDKKIDYHMLAENISQKTKGVALIGQLTESLANQIEASENNKAIVYRATILNEAFAWAKKNAKEGEIVLLSPGTSSYDQFKNLEERGQQFKALVNGGQNGA